MPESDRVCVDCRRPSPETQTQYTLISKYGWRVTRTHATDGEMTLEWRCSACWAVYKTRRARASSLPPPEPGTSQAPAPMPSFRPLSDAQPLDEGETHAGRLFDRAIEALGSKPSKPPRKG